MEYVFDLEVHTKFARACSRDADVAHHVEWAKKKGIDVVGTGDFTHPIWFKELGEILGSAEEGMYVPKGEEKGTVRFLYSAEVSCIWGQGGKTRRVHILIFAPSREAAGDINASLERYGAKLGSDGRPILGMSAERLCEIVFDVSDKCLVVPAHVWTPWFGMYGSKSGFDSLEECFGKFSDRIYAIETGLSSDPPMNWRLKELDSRSIVSFSDAHSPPNLGREATVFELRQLSYQSFFEAVQKSSVLLPEGENRIVYTIEFFPEEGKYHYDGHRGCGIRCAPRETQQHQGVCPSCRKRLTVGVMSRVEEIADRPEGYNPQSRPPFKRLVPLPEIIADALGVGKKTKAVAAEYESLLAAGGSEFSILLRLPEETIRSIARPIIAEGIIRVRREDLEIIPGFDGEYGIISIFSDAEQKEGKEQKRLF